MVADIQLIEFLVKIYRLTWELNNNFRNRNGREKKWIKEWFIGLQVYQEREKRQ